LFQHGGTYIATIQGKTQKKTNNEVELMLLELDQLDKQELELKLKKEEELKQKHLEIEKNPFLMELEREKEKEMSSSDDKRCVYCLEEKATIAIIPCGHLCLCSTCSAKNPFKQCPMCRGEIINTIKIFT